MLAECQQGVKDKQMACCLVYRGNVSTLEANTAVDQVKRSGKINLVEWCPTGFKVGLNKNGPGNVEDSQIMPASKQETLISNSTVRLFAWN